MLQAIRDRAQTWLAWVIVGFISIPFALWGIQEYLGAGGPQLAAEVEGIEISVDEYRDTVDSYRQQQRARLQQIFGNDLDNPMVQKLLDDKVIKQQALDGMIAGRLLAFAAVEAGFNIGEAQIDAMIVNAPDFRKNGKFDNETYERFLRSQGMSSKGFKARVTQDQVTNQLINGLASTAFATDWEVDELLRMQLQQREGGYMTLKAASYEHEVRIDDDNIRANYEANIEQYKTPELISLEYIELNAASVAGTITADEKTLREYYEHRSDDYLVADDTGQRKLLSDIKNRVAAGEDFAALAKQYSQDSGSAENGGDLGLIGRSIMEPSFEKAMFALNAGETSDIVETSLGLHVIKVDEIKGEERHIRHIMLEVDRSKLRTRSFEEVSDRVAQDYRKARIDEIFNDKYDQLNNLSYEHADTLSVASSETGIPVQATELFTRAGGKGIAAIPAVVNVAFSDTVLKEGQNSELLDLGNERVVVLRIKEHKPAVPRPLEEVNDDIIRSLLKEASSEHARRIAEEISAGLKQGGNPQALAAQYNVEWQQARFYTRNDKGLAAPVANELFAMPRPGEGAPGFNVVALPGGDHAVVGLYSVREGDPATASSEERLALAKQITSRSSGAVVSNLQKDLRDKASITLYEKNL